MITVVVPTHSRPTLLIRAVESVLANVPRPDIIVVDDGVTNFGEQAMAGYPVRYESVYPCTVESAINRGFQLADTPWVTWLCDDDEWTPDFMSTMRQAIKNNLDAGVFWGRCWLEPQHTQIPVKVPSGWSPFLNLLQDNFIPGPATLIRRELMMNNSGLTTDPRAQPLSDYELWLRLSKRTTFQYVDVAVAKFWKTPGQKSSWSSEQWGLAQLNLMQFLLVTYDLTDEERRAVEKRLKWFIAYSYWDRHKWFGKIGRTMERYAST